MPGFPSVASLFQSFIRGFRLIDGGEISQLVQQVASGANAFTARAGGGAANATLMTAIINQVSTVANVGDSVLLPQGLAGLTVEVINGGANSLTVFPQQSNLFTGVADQITPFNSSTPGASVNIAANGANTFVCFAPGQWKQYVSA